MSEPRLSPWMLKLGPRKAGIVLVAVMAGMGTALLVVAIVRAHGASTFLALVASFALGAAAVPLLIQLGKQGRGVMPNWLFGGVIGAGPVLASLLPGPAIVALLAMGSGFFLTFIPFFMANRRAHWTEIEARWSSWQG